MKKKIISVIVATSLITGCANLKKEEMGTLAGVVGGAVIGSQVDGARGAIIGAIIAGLVGNRIGSYLDEQDKIKLAELELQSLDSNKEESFVTAKSKAKVTISPQELKLEPQRNFVLSSSLQQHPLVEIEPLSINVLVDTPIYNNLDEKSKPKMIIQKGVQIEIPAEVQNKDWVVVGDKNVGLGYIPKRYLKPEIVAQLAKQNESNIKSNKTQKQTKVSSQKKSDKVIAKQNSSVSIAQNNNAISSASTKIPTTNKVKLETEIAALNVKTKPIIVADKETKAADSSRVVQLARECKVVIRKVDTGSDSDSFTENVKYCKEPPKGWKTQTV
jgi:hypothetical protein